MSYYSHLKCHFHLYFYASRTKITLRYAFLRCLIARHRGSFKAVAVFCFNLDLIAKLLGLLGNLVLGFEVAVESFKARKIAIWHLSAAIVIIRYFDYFGKIYCHIFCSTLLLPNSFVNSEATRCSSLHYLRSIPDFLVYFKLNSNSDCYLNMSYCFVIKVTKNWPEVARTYSKDASAHFSCRMYWSTLVTLID